jgi:leukotriene-A4 hydrolase
LERKITGRMHGNEFAEFSAILGWKALKDSVDRYGDDKNGFTQLVPNLDGKDPDDAFSSVPYVHRHPVFPFNKVGKRIQSAI